jgi:hypothetical protein
MRQEPKSIHEFNPGDILTRVEPSALMGNSFITGGDINYDCSYIGEKLIFVGTANGCAYFERTDTLSYLFKGELLSVPLHRFEYGWAHYIDPKTLKSSKSFSKYSSISNENLVEKLDDAISREDYEEASRIQHEIDKREI